MIKRILKRLLEYCPHPSKPLTTTLKQYTLPIVMFVTASIAMVSSYYLVSLGTTQTISPQVPPSLSLPEVQKGESNYYPGVIEGDYVIYGDFHCNVSHPTGPEWEWLICLGERDWMKVEVVGVSGKGVTLRYTDQLKNGSATDHNGCVHLIYNIEHPDYHNRTCGYYTYVFLSHIVVANLTEGDSIHGTETCPIPPHTVNKTEIRTYFGVDRWVNIMKYVEEPQEVIWVFDRESGILLEYEEISPINRRSGYRIVETNIFPSSSPSTRSSLIQENIETGITPEDPYHNDLLVEADFKIWIGNGELNSPEEEDVVFQPYDDGNYFLVEDWVGGYWEPPSTEDEVYEGWGVSFWNHDPDEEPKPFGTCDVNNQDLIDKLIEIGIYPIKEFDVSNVYIDHVVGNYSTTGNPDDCVLGDFWHLMIMWEIGEFEIANPEWQPDPIVVPHYYILDATTDMGIEPDGEYDETTDTWTITFDTVCELSENTPEPNPETDEWNIKLWEGPLRFTVKIQRILTQ
jgi:hypothetical protein